MTGRGEPAYCSFCSWLQNVLRCVRRYLDAHMTTPTPEKELLALSESVTKQREAAQNALDLVKQIDQVISYPDLDPNLRIKLEALREKALQVTKTLTNNANTTSAAVSSTIGFIGKLVR